MRLCGVRVALVTGGLLLAGTVGVWAQAAKTDAEITLEERQARDFYEKSNFVAALPLYEELHALKPTSLVYDEGLAMSLLASASSMEDPAKASATKQRARSILLEAKAAGDNSNLLQIMLEKLDGQPETAVKAPVSPGAEAFRKAEKAFGSGDMPGALALYEEAAKADPKLYEAPLYAGDTAYKMNDFKRAGEYYARAVAINPNRDTAYRYWGDALMHDGKMAEAEDKFIAAILAQPYQKAPRLGLKQWADANHALFVAPPIQLPARATVDAKGNTNVNLDMGMLMRPAGSAWIVYGAEPAIWSKGKFKEQFPAEKAYRHSLPEEMEALHGVLTMVASMEKDGKLKEKDLDATLKTLQALEKDGMLECWILLDHPDQGLAQDYVAFREGHRDLMAAYVKKYDIHPAGK